jgi:hypothetical protein
MPVLKNARHELFCQAVAQGKELQEAYIEAGFNDGSSGNPSRLKMRKDIERRISELLNKRANKVLQKTAREAEITRDTILAKLDQAYEVAKKARNGSAMTQAAIGQARVMGLIIDRREVGDARAFDSLTDEQLIKEIARLARSLGIAGPRLVEDLARSLGIADPRLVEDDNKKSL